MIYCVPLTYKRWDSVIKILEKQSLCLTYIVSAIALAEQLRLPKRSRERLGHNFIGSEQLLVGLLGTDGTAQLLNAAGVNLEAALGEVEKVIGRGSGFLAVEIPFTPKAKQVIEIAVQSALQGLVLVQPEHLLSGILNIWRALLYE